MKRPIGLLLAAVLLAGCNRNQTPPGNDPFIFGRQTVPPPGTGTAAGRVGDPSYRGGTAVASSTPGPLAPPSVSLPAPSSGSATRDIAAGSAGLAGTPPGTGWIAPAAVPAETSVTPRGAAASTASTRALGTYPGAPAPSASSLAASTPSVPPSVIRIPQPSSGSGTLGGSTSGRTTFTRTLGPRPAAAAPATPAAPAGYRPMPATPPGKPIDIMTLPRADEAGPATSDRAPAGDDGLRLASDAREAGQGDRVLIAGGTTAADGNALR